MITMPTIRATTNTDVIMMTLVSALLSTGLAVGAFSEKHVINTHLPSGPVHPYQLNESI